MRRAARVDENQPEIVRVLRECGADVQPLHAVGKGCPDLLVAYSGRNYLLEVKNPAVPASDRKLTNEQAQWHANWNGQVAIVTTPVDALRVIGAI